MWCSVFAFSFHFLVVKARSLSCAAQVMTPRGCSWSSCGSQRSAIPCCIFLGCLLFWWQLSSNALLFAPRCFFFFFLGNWGAPCPFPFCRKLKWTSKVWGEKLRSPALTGTFFEDRLLSERKIHLIIISHMSKIDPEAFSFATGSHHKSVSAHTHMLYQG